MGSSRPAWVRVLFAGLFAAPLGLGWLAGAGPDRADIQKAYDAAKTQVAAGRHADDLSIRDAQCQVLAGRRYACQVDFVRTAEPAGRLYFTVVTVEQSAAGWVLIGGLCKGP